MNRDDEQKLYNGITNIDEEIIEEAQEARPNRRPHRWLRRGAAAACLCLVGFGAFYAANYFGLLAGFGASGGGSGGEGITYMSYAGPVFPLTVSQEDSGLTAQRTIEFDFSPYQTVTETYSDNGELHHYDYHESQSVVTDRYVLTNDGDTDKTVTAIYPFAASFRDQLAVLPKISLNGVEQAPALYAGPYSGGFEGAWGSGEEGSLNIASLDNWECYRALMEGGYMQKAFDEWPELNQPVIVYELSDRSAAAADPKVENPTLNMEFTMGEGTMILSWGMSGGRNDYETGRFSRSTHVPESFNPDYGQSAYLIVLGDDIQDYGLQGYRDGGCDKGEEIDGVTAALTRYETTLGEMVETLADLFLHDWGTNIEEGDQTILDLISREMFLGAAAELMYDHGPLAQSTAQRYDFGMLEDMFSETQVMQRVMYLTFEVTIPAGGSVELTASMVKEASMDFIGKNKDRNGYDMVTRLGSDLVFTSQTASISNAEDIEIVDQNFGFDLENGVSRVELDLAREHYYLNVRKRPA